MTQFVIHTLLFIHGIMNLVQCNSLPAAAPLHLLCLPGLVFLRLLFGRRITNCAISFATCAPRCHPPSFPAFSYDAWEREIDDHNGPCVYPRTDYVKRWNRHRFPIGALPFVPPVSRRPDEDEVVVLVPASSCDDDRDCFDPVWTLPPLGGGSLPWRDSGGCSL